MPDHQGKAKCTARKIKRLLKQSAKVDAHLLSSSFNKNITIPEPDPATLSNQLSELLSFFDKKKE